MTAFEPIGERWEPLVWISALLSMTIGNFAALLQIEHQAHAGLQLDRARRIRAGGAHRARRDRHRRGDVLPGGVRVHEHRRVRRGQRTSPARASAS